MQGLIATERSRPLEGNVQVEMACRQLLTEPRERRKMKKCLLVILSLAALSGCDDLNDCAGEKGVLVTRFRSYEACLLAETKSAFKVKYLDGIIPFASWFEKSDEVFFEALAHPKG